MKFVYRLADREKGKAQSAKPKLKTKNEEKRF